MHRQVSIPAVLMRGGTSKGVFLHRKLLPSSRVARDSLILGILGTPDPMQIDGLGGTHSSTSKVMAVGPSGRPDCDVDFLFAQGAIAEPIVDYSANCGNLTAAVGAFAVDEGMVRVVEPVTTVRMHNENTNKRVLAHVPIEDGRAAITGNCHIAGVPGTGAAILTEYIDPGGSSFGKLLPTGRPSDSLVVEGFGSVEVSIVDATIPVVFVRAGDLGLRGDELPDDINRDADLLKRLERLRRRAVVLIGTARTVDDAATECMALPQLCWVSPPRDIRTVDGTAVSATEMDLLARIISVGKVHHALPLTGMMCAAVASLLPGTVAYKAGGRGGSGYVRIAHAKGIAQAKVDLDTGYAIQSVSVVRTARRLMAGTIFLRGAAAASVENLAYRKPNAMLIGKAGSRAELATPCLVVDRAALDRNIARAAAICRKAGIALRPHAKTHKSRAIAKRQIDAGAVGICVATVGEAEQLYCDEIRDIHITSIFSQPSKINRIVDLRGAGCALSVVVDSPEIARALAEVSSTLVRPLSVLVDIDLGRHRSGVSDARAAVELAKIISAAPGLNFAGLQAYAGQCSHVRHFDERVSGCRIASETIAEIQKALASGGLQVARVSGGSTGTIFIDSGSGTYSELQCGSYVFMDAEYAEIDLDGSGTQRFEPSLFVKTSVISTNWPGEVTTDAGHKHFVGKNGLPQIVSPPLPAAVYRPVSDEHGKIVLTEQMPRLAIGTNVECMAPHCDPTVNFFDVIHVVEDHTLIDIWPIEARGAL